MLQIPLAFRRRYAEAWAECLEGVGAGSPVHCRLEEGRTKLLLMGCLPGAYAPKELGERFALWEQRRYEELLSRIEAQVLLRTSGRR